MFSPKPDAKGSLPWRNTPPDVLAAVRKAEEGVAGLQCIANAVSLNRKFTLDGRLVGDIGELLLCADFNVLPDQKPKGHAHDLIAQTSTGLLYIQVKLRRATKGGRIEFKYQPECLVVIICSEDWTQWRILYNGSGLIVTDPGIEIRAEDRRILRDGRPSIVHLSQKQLVEASTDARRLNPILPIK